MNLGLTLNVAISLAFSYLLAALLASTVQEIIAGVLKLRGVYLTKAIEALTSLGSDNRFAWGRFPGWWHATFGQTTAEVTRTVDRAGAEVLRAGEAAAKIVAASPGSVRAAMLAVAAIDMIPNLRRTIAAKATPQSIRDAVGKSVVRAVKIGGPAVMILQATADTATAAAGATAASVRAALEAVPAIDLLPGLQDTIQNAATAAGSTAESVIAAVRPAGGIAALQQHPLLVGTPSGLPSYVPSRDFASALLAQLTDGTAANRFAQAQQAIENLPEGDLKRTLLAFISAGADDLVKLRTRIENWFDDSMQRLGGIYTRFTWYVTLALGLIIAVMMNVDSVHMARTFWSEPALSATVAEAATDYVKQHQNDQPNCVQGTTSSKEGAASGLPIDPKIAAECLNASLQAVQSAVAQQHVPIGRATGADAFGCVKAAQIPAKDCTKRSWVVTGLAVSLGAQFWFGMLKDFASLRTSGDKPVRADPAPTS